MRLPSYLNAAFLQLLSFRVKIVSPATRSVRSSINRSSARKAAANAPMPTASAASAAASVAANAIAKAAARSLKGSVVPKTVRSVSPKAARNDFNKTGRTSRTAAKPNQSIARRHSPVPRSR